MKATPFAFPNSRHRLLCRGFTLTELLVVIVIIMVLVALTFSVVTRMKNSAAKTKEVSNMRSIGAMVLTYHSEFGVLPGRPAGGGSGGLNKGVTVPSRSTVAMENSLSTYFISIGYVGGEKSYKSGVDDDLWMTSGTKADKSNSVSMVLNSSTSSAPDNFFGRKQGTDIPPRSLSALQKNRDEKVLPEGVTSQDLSQLWMVATADEENYPPSGNVSTPVKGVSEWGGRVYSFFDGHVDFIKRTTPCTYPSSYNNDYK